MLDIKNIPTGRLYEFFTKQNTDVLILSKEEKERVEYLPEYLGNKIARKIIKWE